MLSIFKLNSDANYESSYFIKIWMPSQTFICLLLLVVVGQRRRSLHRIVSYLRVAYPTKAHVSCTVRALIKIRIIRKRSVSSVFIRPCENERNGRVIDFQTNSLIYMETDNLSVGITEKMIFYYNYKKEEVTTPP